jgi:DNA-binding MarR family transcriptional regulator
VTDAFDATANRLGALALRITDRVQGALTADGARSPSAATAVSVIERFFVDPPRIDALRRVLGLTSSGVVRLVDALEAEGLVTRGAADDGRVTVVALTPEGRRRARTVTDDRAAVLTDTLATLTPAERAQLARLLDKLLVGLVRGPSPGPALCRLCATEVCGAARGEPCPVTVDALDLR